MNTEIKNIKTTVNRKINKLLLVGHENSNIDFVTKTLIASGFDVASDLKRKGIAAEQISKYIDIDSANTHGQAIVSPVYNELALDLIMSNKDKKIWCWADSESINLLDFWKAMDHKLAFMLVYSSPQTFLNNRFNGFNSISESSVIAAIDSWISYNRVLLNFYYRNSSVSMLVCSDQVSKDGAEYLSEIQVQLPISQSLNKELIVASNDDSDSSVDPLKDYLINQLIAENAAIKDMYEELQSSANLPNNDVKCSNISSINAFSHFFISEKENTKVLSNLSGQVRDLKIKKNEIEKSVSSHKNEEELLFQNLFSVQKELEKVYLENKKYKNEKIESTLVYGAADRIKQHLSYKIGQTILKSYNSRFKLELLILPFKLMFELRRFIKEKKHISALPPIYTYVDFQDAEKIKNQLTYILGKEVVECFKSPFGIVKWPLAVIKAKGKYKGVK